MGHELDGKLEKRRGAYESRARSSGTRVDGNGTREMWLIREEQAG